MKRGRGWTEKPELDQIPRFTTAFSICIAEISEILMKIHIRVLKIMR